MIQIDRDGIMPEIEEFSRAKTRRFRDNIKGLSSDVFDKCQEFFDQGVYKNFDPQTVETPLEMRATMGVWVKSEINVSDVDKAWFVPSFVWTWIASQIITYIIKKIIERHWGEISSQL